MGAAAAPPTVKVPPFKVTLPPPARPPRPAELMLLMPRTAPAPKFTLLDCKVLALPSRSEPELTFVVPVKGVTEEPVSTRLPVPAIVKLPLPVMTPP